MTLLAAIVLNALWEDALLVSFVWLLLRVFPQINAATRYVVWSAALAAAVLVPVVTTYASFVPAARVSVASHGPMGGRPSTARPAGAALKMTSGVARVTGRIPKRWVEIPDRVRLTIPVNVARAVVTAWALLAGYALFGLLLGLFRLERLKRDALPLPIEYRDAMPEWHRASKGRREVRLCVSDEIDVPVAVGLFDSMILIPRDLLERLSPSEVEQISLHELAHLRRGDDWSNFVQRLVVAALGCNPAALYVAQQLELEREVACDDWVLSSVRSVRPYAMCLTKMAETAAWPHHPMPAPGVFTTRKQISLRIERLLASGRDIATTLSLGPAAIAVAGVAAAAFVIGMVAPTIAAPAIGPVATAAPAAGVARIVHAAPVAHTAPHVTTVERIMPIVRVTPIAIATPLRQHLRRAAPLAAASAQTSALGVASSFENEALHMAGSAIADAQSIEDGSAHAIPSHEFSKHCSSCDYHGVNWAGRDLRGAHYSVVDFTRATLSGANFSDSVLDVVDFTKANLAGAAFRHAHLATCDFSHANLTSADFSGAVLSQCTFSGAALDGAQFAGAKLVECDLSGVNLHGVDLSHAQLIDMNEIKQPPLP